jgi:hypothetical protein
VLCTYLFCFSFGFDVSRWDRYPFWFPLGLFRLVGEMGSLMALIRVCARIFGISSFKQASVVCVLPYFFYFIALR